ncbi:MAG TPA: ShlB/FhaC/HecB family hemolysin secretion/activation protein, partial [Coleofasciculaceae cyanobacterium]
MIIRSVHPSPAVFMSLMVLVGVSTQAAAATDSSEVAQPRRSTMPSELSPQLSALRLEAVQNAFQVEESGAIASPPSRQAIDAFAPFPPLIPSATAAAATGVATPPFNEVSPTLISQVNPTAPSANSSNPPGIIRQRINEPAPAPTLPDQPLPPLPPPAELLPQPQSPNPPAETPGVPTTVFVRQFKVEGSTVFSPEELAAVTAPYAGRNLSFAELLQARAAVTQFYVDRGYITSGAYIPPQTLEDGVVTIQVIEGSLEGINVTGTRRLHPGYIRSRLAIAAATPLNTNRLLEGLRLLQINPLIRNISADLQAGTRPGTSLLQVQVTEADTFSGELVLNNGRSPSVGSFQRGAQLTEANLLGLGDGLSIDYYNTDGSNQFDGTYTLPLNPRNGTLQLAVGATRSHVIEPPFGPLDITSNSRYAEITLRQPLYQTSTEEFALGLTASRQESKAKFSPFDTPEQPFPSLGADEEGRTRISALQFFQEWTKRSSSYVLAARSQFSLGLNLLNSTISDSGPDSRFFAWRGQGQWVRLLAPDTLLLLRADAQIANTALLPLEQFSLGGQDTVRGYRQDFLLTD